MRIPEFQARLMARSMIEVDHHSPSRGSTMRLAGMECHRVLPSEFKRGDFAYYYSDQLDAFSLYECVRSTDYEVELVEIDSDQYALEGRPTIEKRGATLAARYSLWRASNPKQREAVEAKGFPTSGFYWSWQRRPGPRSLAIKLYHRSLLKNLINTLSWGLLFPRMF